MKNLIMSKLIVLLFGVLLFSSCQKESDNLVNAITEFEEFKQNLQNDQHYIAYMQAKTDLYNNTKKAEIDLVGIHNFIQENEVEKICDVDPTLLIDIKGGQLYQQLFCEGLLTNYKQIVKNNRDDLSKLNDEHIKELFSYSPNEASTRANCLEQFHLTVIYADYFCELYDTEYEGSYIPAEDCIQTAYINALDAYDDCMG